MHQSKVGLTCKQSSDQSYLSYKSDKHMLQIDLRGDQNRVRQKRMNKQTLSSAEQYNV